MTRVLRITTAIGLFLASPAFAQQASTAQAPPATRVEVVADTLHGVVIEDPYRWLEDQDAPETRAWIDAQNEYTESILGDLAGRDRIEERLSELLRIEEVSTPRARDGRYFFTRRAADQDLDVIHVREGPDGEGRALVDPHTLDPEHLTSVNIQDVSEDGRLLAYGVRQGGEDEVEIRLLDVETGEELADRLPKARYFGVAITPDNQAFYYTRFGPEGPRVHHHRLGEPVEQDELVFGKGYGPEKILFAQLSEDGSHLGFVVLHGSSADKTEIYVQDLAAGGPIRTVVNDLDARFFPDWAGEALVLHTNWEAPNGRVLRVPLDRPGREHWVEIVPETDAVIDGISTAGGKLFVNYLEDVKSRVEIFDLEGNPEGSIAFPTIGTVTGVSGRWGSDEAFFSFTSFHVPTTIYRYDVGTGERVVWHRLDVPVDKEALAVEQVWYTSKDGTRVPMFLVHRKDVEPTGEVPTLLLGYGGFTLSNTPRFLAPAVLWTERGGLFALPNLRGGGEFGEAWHRAGMLENKQNVFDDFIAAAEWLVEHGWTNPERLGIAGRSNGGLLMGAVTNQRPDLFGAVVVGYPLLDMLRYHRFLVAKFWVPEYGSAEDPEQFEFLRAYSPYHNVKEGAEYPAILFVSGDSDTRVAPLHARKMAALMQAATGSDEPVLLKYDTEAGHSGGLPVSKQIEELSSEASFLLWQLGELEGSPAAATGGR